MVLGQEDLLDFWNCDFDGVASLYESFDAENWRFLGPLPESSQGLNRLEYADGLWIARFDSYCIEDEWDPAETFWTSTDGVEWSNEVSRDQKGTYVSSIAFGAGRWISVGAWGSENDLFRPCHDNLVLHVSVDGRDWEHLPSQLIEEEWEESSRMNSGGCFGVGPIAYGDGTWVIANNARMLVSRNGVAWAPLIYDLEPGWWGFSDIHFADDTWIAVGSEKIVRFSLNRGLGIKRDSQGVRLDWVLNSLVPRGGMQIFPLQTLESSEDLVEWHTLEWGSSMLTGQPESSQFGSGVHYSYRLSLMGGGQRFFRVRETLDFGRTRFSDKILSYGRFRNGSFYRSGFIGCRLDGADFCEANLRFATFSESSCMGASFRDADLTEARFENCQLANADFTGAIGFDPTKGENRFCNTILPDGTVRSD